MFSYSTSIRERVRLVVPKALIAIPVVLMSTLVAAQAPYLRAGTPITDTQGRVQAIIDFVDDAHMAIRARCRRCLPRKISNREREASFFILKKL